METTVDAQVYQRHTEVRNEFFYFLWSKLRRIMSKRRNFAGRYYGRCSCGHWASTLYLPDITKGRDCGHIDDPKNENGKFYWCPNCKENAKFVWFELLNFATWWNPFTWINSLRIRANYQNVGWASIPVPYEVLESTALLDEIKFTSELHEDVIKTLAERFADSVYVPTKSTGNTSELGSRKQVNPGVLKKRVKELIKEFSKELEKRSIDELRDLWITEEF